MTDGHFSPAGIDCSHTCLVLFSSYTAHNRAVGTDDTHVIHYKTDRTDRRHSNLTNGGYELRPPMGSAYLLVSTPTWMKRFIESSSNIPLEEITVSCLSPRLIFPLGS